MTETPEVFHNENLRIGIFVIAYNAESHIEKTLSRIPQSIWQAVAAVYVVDDCSSDETTARALQLQARYPLLQVLRNRKNRRYGGNQKIGYQYAIDHHLDVVVMLHADGQYAPECLAEILTPIVTGQADVVFGSRMLRSRDALRGGMPRYKYVGNRILTHLQNRICGMHLSEFHSGYRAYRVDFLRQIPLWENTDEWHFDTQILLQAHAAHKRIIEVPIPTYYGDEICHVNGISYGMFCILTAIKYWLHNQGVLYSRVFDLQTPGGWYRSKLDDPYSSHSLILAQVESLGPLPGRQVLELGVGDAAITQRLAAQGAAIDCIELQPKFAHNAEPFCRTVIAEDLNQLGNIKLPATYDVILAADVLEHLVDPEYVLSVLKKWTRPKSRLIVSLPNIANIYVRMNLLLGRFPIHTKGILDGTHLHHYTLKTAEAMLWKTGWIVEKKLVTTIPLGIVFPFLKGRIFRGIYRLFYSLTRWCRGLLGYQGIFVCRNPNQAGLL